MSKGLRAARIIMVDDDPDDIFLTDISFRNAAFPAEFTGLESAEKLFEYIKDNGIGSIDILLLDLNMPVMGGLEALEMLRDYPHFEDLNVFMFSTSSSETDKKACLEAGAKAYLYKPSGLTQMRSFVETIGKSINIDLAELSIAS